MAKHRSFGAKLQYNTTSTTFVDVANLLSVRPPSTSMDTVDMTTHDSASGYREFVGSFLDGGTCTATFLYDQGNTTHVAIHTSYGAAELKDWKVLCAGTEFSFEGLITEWSVGDLTVDGRFEVSISIKVSGPVTIGAAA